MRKFAFVVFDIDNSILDRFKLDMISAPSGLGWKLKLSKIEGDIVDTLTKVVQEKQSVSLTVNLVGQGYQKFRILSQWLQKYSTANSRLALEYDDGLLQRYVEGKVTELKKTEIDEYGNLSCAASFTPVSPFFTQNQSTILIKVSAKGMRANWTVTAGNWTSARPHAITASITRSISPRRRPRSNPSIIYLPIPIFPRATI